MSLAPRRSLCALLLTPLTFAACASEANTAPVYTTSPDAGFDAAVDSTAPPEDAGADKIVVIEGGLGDANVKECQPCSIDGKQVLNCDGTVKQTCDAGQRCGQVEGGGECMASCKAAEANKSTVGCDYFAIAMSATGSGFGGCFVTFVANTFEMPVKLQASWGTQPIDLAKYAKIPSGTGTSVKYGAYDPAVGLAPNQVAILFLANDPVPHGTWPKGVACPVPAAIGLDAQVHMGMSVNTGRGTAFHITTDNPVVAYQMLPFGGGSAATTGATLLLPTSAWDTNYIGIMPARSAEWQGMQIPPTLEIVAKEDTKVTILPTKEIKAGIDVMGGSANTKVEYQLKAGEFIEFIQNEELSGSPIESDKPIAVFAGHAGLRVPYQVDWSDHAEQQLPPVRALGHEYAAGTYRDRYDGIVEHRRWRIMGVVKDTKLTYDPPLAAGPNALYQGDLYDFESDVPFVVRSQDADHPFLLFGYMSGSSTLADQGAPAGYGDPEFVRVVPGAQYMTRYVFFTDPTFPETNLVVVRRKGKSGFADVNLDCAGNLTGWAPIGSGASYEMTRIDLSRHNFEPQGKCDNGRHEMTSTEQFGVTVWGWGGPETRADAGLPCDQFQPDNSCDVSYAYPAGENLVPINTVFVPTTPK